MTTSPNPKRDLRCAYALTTDMVNRQATVRIGDVSGTLHSVIPVRGQVTLVLLVGGLRATFQLDATTVVEVERSAS